MGKASAGIVKRINKEDERLLRSLKLPFEYSDFPERIAKQAFEEEQTYSPRRLPPAKIIAFFCFSDSKPN